MKPGAVRNLGCAHGRRAVKNPRLRDAIVILAFGRPLQRGNRYGASLFGDAFHATPDIGATGERYAEAFVRCSEGLDRARVRLALGTSNYGSQVSFSHGRAWALMVNRANERLQARGFSRKVTIVGANDIELSWNGPGVSKAWVRGYASAAWWPFFNFGDAAACPPRGNCAPGWTQEDIWYVSWGAWPAWPLPQVYNGSQALQWHRLSLYAHQRHGYRMHILGVVSQRGACIQRSDPCLGMNNSPRRAWAQLAEALNSDPRTTQPLRWVTDISWVD